MIEKIISEWNQIDSSGQLVIGAMILVLLGFILYTFIPPIIKRIRNSQKTITQKWQEGLIGQPKSRSKIPPQYSSYQPTINLPPGVKEIK